MAKIHQIKIPHEEWKLSYLAGLIDGEGSIGMTQINDKPVPYLQITMCNEEVFKWIKNEFGGGCFSQSVLPSGKIAFHWHCQSRGEIHRLLSYVEKYLIVKKLNAQKVISKINCLGIPPWFWSEEEEIFIKQNYPSMPNTLLVEKLNKLFGKKRTRATIRVKACRLGVLKVR